MPAKRYTKSRYRGIPSTGRVLAIDPGTTESAAVAIDDGVIMWMDILPNRALLYELPSLGYYPLAIEMVASYGMPVGETTFETVLWIGRFIQEHGGEYCKVYRNRAGDLPSVKMHHCHDSRAKDGNIRQAIIDRFPPLGGGQTPQIGTKKQPGPLYGIRSHLWAALAVALVWLDIIER